MVIKCDKEKVFSGNTHYCPGCGHNTVHTVLGKVMGELNIAKKTIIVNSVGCSVLMDRYFKCDHKEAAHGRAPAEATMFKELSNPDEIILTYQGDGDLAGIGLNHIVQAASRGENFTVFFINNANYGMTGGQMAPTSLGGQITTTTPNGRDIHKEGYPLRICEMLDTLEAPAYLERVAVYDKKELTRSIKEAIQTQMDGKGFSLVEILTNCPEGLRMTVPESMDFVRNKMKEVFPLRKFRPK